ncbi:MAG: type II secretion system GspH family protein [Gemmataceae bacterium]|nr:type II secretion system GspH family protein [Gemmataceae bacterium]
MSKTLRSRPGFTLIELLVVIAIIGVLVALTTAGVMRVRVSGTRSQVSIEIGQLDAACKAFKAKFGFNPPSRLRLSDTATDYTTPAFQETTTYLTSMYPKINFAAFASSYSDLRKQSSLPTGSETLEGHQCLVLFLGGPAFNNNPNGFSTNPTNPFDTAGDRVKFYEFQSGRLVKLNASSPFPSYKDAWTTNVYAYLSSGRRANGYNSPSDGTGLGVSPYFTTAGPPVVYVNSNTTQIISAGQDGIFGPGGLIDLANPAVSGTASDDQTNFTSGILAAGQRS